jgi:hypothetical protein
MYAIFTPYKEKKMRQVPCILFIFLAISYAELHAGLINKVGMTVESRFRIPNGYERLKTDTKSFAYYLRTLPLKPDSAKIIKYNGKQRKFQYGYAAIIDFDVGNEDLQQCADAIIRLRAEYLFLNKKYSDIHFNFTSGDKAEFVKFAEGYRPVISRNKVTWQKSSKTDYSYSCFRRYLDMVFRFAGTFSLYKELHPVLPNEELNIGDIAIKGGFPGHALIIVDKIKHKKTGKIKYLIAQGLTPAQSIHILYQISISDRNPWFELKSGKKLIAIGAYFENTEFKRF